MYFTPNHTWYTSSSVTVLTMSTSQLVRCSFGTKLQCIRSRSVSMIHALHLASVSKQLICRDLNLFQIESQKKSDKKSQIKSRSLKSNLYSSNWISKCVQWWTNPNRNWDLPITGRGRLHAVITECRVSNKTQMPAIAASFGGNESVPMQLAQCWFPGLAISNANIYQC